MIDVDIALRLHAHGLSWDPHDGDWFVIDVPDLRESPFMLSEMVVERGRGRLGEPIFKFNGTTEWALDTIEEHEAVWIPREEQLRESLGEAFVALRRAEDGAFVVTVRLGGGAGAEDDGNGGTEREIRAPHAEAAYAGALLVLFEESAE
jgi:hypothetical protein